MSCPCFTNGWNGEVGSCTRRVSRSLGLCAMPTRFAQAWRSSGGTLVVLQGA